MTDPQPTARGTRLQDFLREQARDNRPRQLDSWLSKARLIRSQPAGEPWPAWSTGEILAVAVLLDDTDHLAAEGYTTDEALERLRFEIDEPTIPAARAVFDQLRAALDQGTPERRLPLSGLAPRWAALAARYATDPKVAEDTQALARADQPEHTAHAYLIGCLLELGEAHAGCTAVDCPTCAALTRAVSMVLAENELRQGRVPGAVA